MTDNPKGASYKAHVLTRQEFEVLSPRAKGFAVYMAGCRDDQPNVPEVYEPSLDDMEEYERGQFEAILVVQDSP